MLENIKEVKKITSSMIRYCESEGDYTLAKLLKNSNPSSEEIYFDNWNGGTYTYAFIYEIEIDDFRKNRSMIDEYERVLYEIARVFINGYGNEQLGQIKIRPICRQYIDWNQGFTKEELVSQIEQIKSMMITVSTGGANIKDMNDEYKTLYSQLHTNLTKAGLDDPNKLSDLWVWYGRWSQGDMPHYSDRRKYVNNMYNSIREVIDNSAGSLLSEEYVLTGWERVDRAVYEMKCGLSTANTEEQFQEIGMLGRETLITVAQQVFNRDLHKTEDGTIPSDTDSKRMLDAFLNYSLMGASNEKQRKFAKSSVDLANQLTHDRTAQRSDAELCLVSVTAVINTIRIIANS